MALESSIFGMFHEGRANMKVMKNNICKNYQERVSDPKLTENGHLQSTYLAEFLQKGLHLSQREFEENKRPFDQIFCSAMQRSLETVGQVGVAIGLKPEVWLDIHEANFYLY